MQNCEADEQLQEKMIKALCCMQAQILMNSYVSENVVFKQIQSNEQLPFYSYIKDLDLQSIVRYIDIDQMDGPMIEQGRIKDLAYDDICFELYRDKIDLMFYEAPKYSDSDTNYADDIYHYKHGLYEYLKELYTIFRNIVEVEVTPDFFSTIPDITDKDERRLYYDKATKFVTTIKLKHLRQGCCVNRYVKDFTLMSPFIQRLLKEHKGRYILTNNNTDSLDYKLALLSCFRFHNEYNAKLFELKALRWEELKFSK
ncbi:MAG: hypothetical protein J1G38_00010 [Clostridiales bacterium]|nr:hypothetical protein [Clostridiales bacterium]